MQRPILYNKLLPYAVLSESHAHQQIKEIKLNLSRSVQKSELWPGALYWTNRLKRWQIRFTCIELVAKTAQNSMRAHLLCLFICTSLMNQLRAHSLSTVGTVEFLHDQWDCSQVSCGLNRWHEIIKFSLEGTSGHYCRDSVALRNVANFVN